MVQSVSEPQASLVRLASESNEQLESAGAASANHAFNLGCSISLLPGLLILVLVFFLSRSSWVTLAVTAMLILIAVVGFANLAAYTAKGKGIDRAYEVKINPEIERTLRQMELTRADFDQIAHTSLPEDATLRRYLSPRPTQEEAKI